MTITIEHTISNANNPRIVQTNIGKVIDSELGKELCDEYVKALLQVLLEDQYGNVQIVSLEQAKRKVIITNESNELELRVISYDEIRPSNSKLTSFRLLGLIDTILLS